MKWLAVVVLAASLSPIAGGCGRVGYDAEALRGSHDSGTGIDGSPNGPKPDGGPGMAPAGVCGDRVVTGSEACDDGNSTNADGCDDDCTFSCVESSECDDGLVCNGTETCMEHRCVAGAPPPDGTACESGTCMGGSCVRSTIDGGVGIGPVECGTRTCSGGRICCCAATSTCSAGGGACPDVVCKPTS